MPQQKPNQTKKMDALVAQSGTWSDEKSRRVRDSNQEFEVNHGVVGCVWSCVGIGVIGNITNSGKDSDGWHGDHNDFHG